MGQFIFVGALNFNLGGFDLLGEVEPFITVGLRRPFLSIISAVHRADLDAVRPPLLLRLHQEVEVDADVG